MAKPVPRWIKMDKWKGPTAQALDAMNDGAPLKDVSEWTSLNPSRVYYLWMNVLTPSERQAALILRERHRNKEREIKAIKYYLAGYDCHYCGWTEQATNKPCPKCGKHHWDELLLPEEFKDRNVLV